jgi:cytochrome b involved in lipid metabolism
MAILIDRQEGETGMKRSKRQLGQKTEASLESSQGNGLDRKRTLRYYAMTEIAQHNTEASAWIIAGDDIYDVTEYMHQHPAGKEPILRRTGGAMDCTQDLMFHSKRGQNMWKEQCLIGKVTNKPSLNGQPVEKPWWAFWE